MLVNKNLFYEGNFISILLLQTAVKRNVRYPSNASPARSEMALGILEVETYGAAQSSIF
jgi:hypothetical protein